VGANVCYGRAIAEAHYRACLYAGLKISGLNVEVMPSQLEYQIGPCEGIEIGDQLWMSRYLIHRVAEDFNVVVSFAPKLFSDWNGSGGHTNYSTETMRQGSGGMEYIAKMMSKFDLKHKLHISLYGDDNQKRLTGIHETSSCEKFSWACGDRSTSFRVPTSVLSANGKGYIEDRRPASNLDPYVVGAMIADTSLLDNESQASPLIAHFSKWQLWRKTADMERLD
jgi:glutamine synthetase